MSCPGSSRANATGAAIRRTSTAPCESTSAAQKAKSLLDYPELYAGTPRIWVGSVDGSVTVVTNCMTDEETTYVAERLRETLVGGGR